MITMKNSDGETRRMRQTMIPDEDDVHARTYEKALAHFAMFQSLGSASSRDERVFSQVRNPSPLLRNRNYDEILVPDSLHFILNTVKVIIII